MRLFVILAASLALAACATVAAPPSTAQTPAATAAPAPMALSSEQQLLEAERQLAASANQSGYGAAVAPMLDEAGFVLRPGRMLETPEDVAAGLDEAARAGSLFWQPDRVFVSQSGDLGVTSGRYVQVMTNSLAVQGRYVTTWRKDSAGEWRILTETRVPDPPRRRR